MLLGLAVVFVVVPFVELYVILQVGHAIGLANTLALVILVSVCGAWLVKREGLGVLRRVRDQLDMGRMPGTEVVDGALILLSGALLVTPGFVTDALGILLLFPPVRAGVRLLARRRLARGLARSTTVYRSW